MSLRDDSGQMDQRVTRSHGGTAAPERSEGARRNGARPSGRASDAVGGSAGAKPPGSRMTREAAADAAIGLAERGWVPDRILRSAIRALCAQRLRDVAPPDGQIDHEALKDFIDALRDEDVAPVPGKANDQHYEVPAELFRLMLGPQMKYSCCWWDEDVRTLADAEQAALERTALHAGVENGMRILELGCGWGSLSLWMASRFPGSRIVGVSNSAGQRTYIEREAARLGLSNLQVVTADMNAFTPSGRFDRIVSIEMFEHMRNYHVLLDRIAGWLAPGGRLFAHVFCHRTSPYLFEEEGAGNWMARHFFSGGLMPSADLLPSIPSPLAVERQWSWDGRHYERTANAWLVNLDARRDAALGVLAATYGRRDAVRWLGRWRIFFMACAELFGYDGGREWGVAHYRFAPAAEARALEAAS
jgi:cyclopropane-fatty-acyl-phospholipid synthase